MRHHFFFELDFDFSAILFLNDNAGASSVDLYLAELTRVGEPNCLHGKKSVVDPGGGGQPVHPLFWSFFYCCISEVYEQKISNEYEICLKMLEMAILETQISKNYGGACPRPP